MHACLLKSHSTWGCSNALKSAATQIDRRSIAERALRNVIANKDAEAARLRGEVQRMRSSKLQESSAQHMTGSEQHPSQHVPSETSATDAATDPAARQAVLEAAVAAKEKPTALVHQLQRYTVLALASTCRTPSEPLTDASMSCSLQVLQSTTCTAVQKRRRRPSSNFTCPVPK
jgi:hypothetical protein